MVYSQTKNNHNNYDRDRVIINYDRIIINRFCVSFIIKPKKFHKRRKGKKNY